MEESKYDSILHFIRSGEVTKDAPYPTASQMRQKTKAFAFQTKIVDGVEVAQLLHRSRSDKDEDLSGDEELGPYPRVVRGRAAIRSILMKYHSDKLSGGHVGEGRTIGRLSSRFYWKGMTKDAKEFVKECIKCRQANADSTKLHRPPLRPIAAHEVMEHLVIDIVKIGPVTKRGNLAVCNIIDLYSGWVFSRAIPDETAETVALHLLDISFLFGFWTRISSDRGAAFVSDLFAEVNRLLGADVIHSTAYHPQSQGKVERFNKTLRTMLAKLCQDRGEDWDLYLPLAIHHYNTTKQSTTGFSPFLLMFGREAQLPADLSQDFHFGVPVSQKDATLKMATKESEQSVLTVDRLIPSEASGQPPTAASHSSPIGPLKADISRSDGRIIPDSSPSLRVGVTSFSTTRTPTPAQSSTAEDAEPADDEAPDVEKDETAADEHRLRFETLFHKRTKLMNLVISRRTGAQRKQQEQYDAKFCASKTYQPGDLVMLANSRRRKNSSSNKAHYLGPFKVTSVTPRGLYKLQDLVSKTTRKAAVGPKRLKPFQGSEEAAVAQLSLPSDPDPPIISKLHTHPSFCHPSKPQHSSDSPSFAAKPNLLPTDPDCSLQQLHPSRAGPSDHPGQQQSRPIAPAQPASSPLPPTLSTTQQSTPPAWFQPFFGTMQQYPSFSMLHPLFPVGFRNSLLPAVGIHLPATTVLPMSQPNEPVVLSTSSFTPQLIQPTAVLPGLPSTLLQSHHQLSDVTAQTKLTPFPSAVGSTSPLAPPCVSPPLASASGPPSVASIPAVIDVTSESTPTAPPKPQSITNARPKPRAVAKRTPAHQEAAPRASASGLPPPISTPDVIDIRSESTPPAPPKPQIEPIAKPKTRASSKRKPAGDQEAGQETSSELTLVGWGGRCSLGRKLTNTCRYDSSLMGLWAAYEQLPSFRQAIIAASDELSSMIRDCVELLRAALPADAKVRFRNAVRIAHFRNCTTCDESNATYCLAEFNPNNTDYWGQAENCLPLLLNCYAPLHLCFPLWFATRCQSLHCLASTVDKRQLAVVSLGQSIPSASISLNQFRTESSGPCRVQMYLPTGSKTAKSKILPDNYGCKQVVREIYDHNIKQQRKLLERLEQHDSSLTAVIRESRLFMDELVESGLADSQNKKPAQVNCLHFHCNGLLTETTMLEPPTPDWQPPPVLFLDFYTHDLAQVPQTFEASWEGVSMQAPTYRPFSMYLGNLSHFYVIFWLDLNLVRLEDQALTESCTRAWSNSTSGWVRSDGYPKPTLVPFSGWPFIDEHYAARKFHLFLVMYSQEVTFPSQATELEIKDTWTADSENGIFPGTVHTSEPSRRKAKRLRTKETANDIVLMHQKEALDKKIQGATADNLLCIVVESPDPARIPPVKLDLDSLARLRRHHRIPFFSNGNNLCWLCSFLAVAYHTRNFLQTITGCRLPNAQNEYARFVGHTATALQLMDRAYGGHQRGETFQRTSALLDEIRDYSLQISRSYSGLPHTDGVYWSPIYLLRALLTSMVECGVGEPAIAWSFMSRGRCSSCGRNREEEKSGFFLQVDSRFRGVGASIASARDRCNCSESCRGIVVSTRDVIMLPPVLFVQLTESFDRIPMAECVTIGDIKCELTLKTACVLRDSHFTTFVLSDPTVSCLGYHFDSNAVSQWGSFTTFLQNFAPCRVWLLSYECRHLAIDN